MSKQQFIIAGEEYVGYTQGNAYIISNGECQFSIWESKEDAQKVCDYLNEQLRRLFKEMKQPITINLTEEDEKELRKLLGLIDDE